MASNAFESAQTLHQDIVGNTPVVQDLLTSSLSTLETMGATLLVSQDLGQVRYADVMTKAYSGALDSDADGGVVPPFSEAQKTHYTNQIEKLSVFLVSNTGGDEGEGPTDTSSVPTDGRKQ